ncbi:MAG: peptide chain release factor N(5)-glutamine methyltransferase [Gammaproteobacteria bacterium]|nr:peptide chain release factor N(5)-glutamine methyltransferase [Gammaproteobacteria bacterium]MBU1775927.1 peptide chain release factor N(5)-glutamine methyltransferase [Gammaproteobacteria bacterium]MBU1968158.1 peptide chain release factor N(5)-glutamine methyltransferase [Gammaproteobacteria bacterium]
MRSIRDVLSQDGATLATAIALARDEARIEVQMLLQRALNVGRAYLLAHPEQILDVSKQAEYEAMLQRRQQGEPIAHILGEREFYGLSFKVTPATLIPRPETELLVELALQRIPSHGKCRVLDLGTGTGAIAISIAHERQDAEVVAVDASSAALEVARENAQRLGIDSVRFVQSDWFSALGAHRFDLVVSNPPYISAGDKHLKQGDVRFEPVSALTAGADGLDDIRRIVRDAGQYLETGGWLLLEHGYHQAEKVRDLLSQNGFWKIFSEMDLAGIARVSGGMANHLVFQSVGEKRDSV